ncbi:hypothetical protein DFH09DRAFT_1312609 [Mycena vulgaris]|nr:hypothetical protein DFH09DRAFT_1312609 [Mycena vulgaris]
MFDLLSPGLAYLNLVLLETLLSEALHSSQSASPFCLGLVGHLYLDWSLTNIGIWEKRFVHTPISSTDEKVLMEHLARVIPGLLTFQGERFTKSKYEWYGA